MSLIEKIDALLDQSPFLTEDMNIGYQNAVRDIKQIILSEQKEPCEYILEDEDSNTWECSKCGELWQLISGAPKDNNMNYCPSCGRPLNQPYTDTDEVFNRR